MKDPDPIASATRIDLADRLFFRMYQCANMLHKTGSRAVAAEGLTTPQWAVLGALSRPAAREGMAIGELARHLMVSRQNLAGVLARLERDGRVASASGGTDRRSRRVTLTAAGRRVWQDRALPRIHAFCQAALADFSVDDMAHALHYLLRLLENMERIDAGAAAGDAVRATRAPAGRSGGRSSAPLG